LKKEAIEREEEKKREIERQKIEAEQFKNDRKGDLNGRADYYKQFWDKNGVIQFKNERLAILQRTWGLQVQFIVAFDDLTNEGYELKAIDEGKTAGDSYTGGQNSYYYFQKM
jgi:hypothetical protein